jgi:hypothetical protein
MLPEMHNVLLDLAPLTVGAYSLVVVAVLLSVALNVNRSYVDADLCCSINNKYYTRIWGLSSALGSDINEKRRYPVR